MREMTPDQIVTLAKGIVKEKFDLQFGPIQFDEEPRLELDAGREGTYVQAYVWVPGVREIRTDIT